MRTRLHSIVLTMVLLGALSLVAPGAHGGAAIAASRWVPVGAPAMIYAQDSAHSAIVALPDGGALLIHGSGQPRTVSTFVERYVPATGRWVAAAPLPTAGATDNATVLPDGRVLVVGGFRREALLYDPANDSWALTVGPRTTGETHAAVLLPSGRVLAVGPFGAEVYDPVANAWTATSTPNTRRFVHSLAVVLPDGRVLVAGGYIFKGTHGPLDTSSAEIYDPRSNDWTLAEPMNADRGMIGGTLLPDGRVLVVGGYDASAEIYDPATGRWTAIGVPPFIGFPRIRARGVVSLLDGNVLILADSWTGTPVGNCPLVPVVVAYETATGVWREAGGESFDRGSTNRFLIRLADGTPMVAGGGACRGDFAFFPPIPVPALLLPPDPLHGMLFNSYRTLLDREPARRELDAWADYVGRACGADRVATAVATILGSHEFRALRQLRPADLPSALYRATLLRGADAQAIDDLRAHFQGVRTTFAVDGFLHSGEGRTVGAALLAGSLARDGYVRRLYEELLGRPPEAEALSAWTSFIDSDHAVDVFVRTILTSAEFEARPATLEGFIASLYRGLLLRPPFDAERDAWTSAYAQAVLDVATGALVPSQEFGELAERICRE